MMKKILKAIWNEFVYGGHLLALGFVGIGVITAIVLNVKVTWDFIVVVYAPTIAACLFGRFRDIREDAVTNPSRYHYLEKKIRIMPFLIITLLLLMIIVSVLVHKYAALFFAIGLVSMSFLYELIFKDFTKKIIGFKNFWSSAIFTLISVLFVVYYNAKVAPEFFCLLIFFYSMSFFSTSFSDIKDIKVDSEKGLKTIASTIGIKNLVNLLSNLSIVVGLLILIWVLAGYLPKFSLILLLAIAYNIFHFRLALRKNIDYDFLVDVISDAQYLLWVILIAIGKVVFS